MYVCCQYCKCNIEQLQKQVFNTFNMDSGEKKKINEAVRGMCASIICLSHQLYEIDERVSNLKNLLRENKFDSVSEYLEAVGSMVDIQRQYEEAVESCKPLETMIEETKKAMITALEINKAIELRTDEKDFKIIVKGRGARGELGVDIITELTLDQCQEIVKSYNPEVCHD